MTFKGTLKAWGRLTYIQYIDVEHIGHPEIDLSYNVSFGVIKETFFVFCFLIYFGLLRQI